ncbi:class I SAM-dependent methyltransferase [Bradyrhizobium sp. CB1650]|uniref:class I SAM-dependent methyltransferase n=1 Tax=Bradyrhizobium sp. CB1650 TaxID=3039153 RepID=UPI0024361142|nr:class I SAM-dependent methyltransferase [Bradyrhizobium sp. CB1650]WGD54940.1 class I SAM-dependent methyltransferase [Bradyrhizobium sp. CB1650]
MKTFHPPHAILQLVPSRLREGLRDLVDTAFVNERSDRLRIRTSREILDHEYARGRWDYLSRLEEMTRYAVIVGYCRCCGDVSSVLDLGCGSGVLRRWLHPLPIDYVGVDLSDLAVETARREWADAATRFVAMDIATYVPDRKFDLIVFNEVLYYFDQPDQILERFSSFLEQDGRFVISLWESPESHRAWRRARDSVQALDEVKLQHGSGVSWRVRLCRPNRRAP